MSLISFPQGQHILLKLENIRSPLLEIQKVEEVEENATEKVSI